MTEFEREWAQAERERHSRLLYQLKRELVAKRQADAVQATQQRTAPVAQSAVNASLPSTVAPTASARPLPRRLTLPAKQSVGGDAESGRC